MKKALLVVVFLLSISGLRAQTIVSGHIAAFATDSMYHDSTQCATVYSLTYNITIDSSYVGDSVNIVDTVTATLLGTFVNTSGVSPWTFSTTPYNTAQWDVFLTGAYMYFYSPVAKIISGADTLKYLVKNDSLYVPHPCTYGMVTGSVYSDNNGNCIFDAGDVGINTSAVTIWQNFSTPSGTVTWNSGWGPTTFDSATFTSYTYSLQQSWLINYTVSLPPYFAFIFPNSPCFSGSYTFSTVPQTGVDFPLQCTSNVDVQCYVLSPASVRLHRSFYMQPYVSNTGCDSVSGQLTFVKDSRVIYDSALSTYPADIVHGDTLLWNYSGISNLSGGAYWNSFLSDIYLSPDNTVAVGDTLCFRVYANIPSADVNPLNNDYTVCLPVVYSFDPNTKEVSPVGAGSPGYIPAGTDTLTYSMHFQNTGNDVAYNINIIDTLDSHINAGTLKILGTSHSMSPVWLAPGVVQFNYNNINLPDSASDQAASIGDVRFSVVLNSGLAPGTPIRNRGYIYFDSNPPVVTNAVLNTIAYPNKIDQAAINPTVHIYPIPVTNELNVTSTEKITDLIITSLVGQVVYNNRYDALQVQIDVSNLPAGVYFLKINGIEVKKFVKE